MAKDAEGLAPVKRQHGAPRRGQHGSRRQGLGRWRQQAGTSCAGRLRNRDCGVMLDANRPSVGKPCPACVPSASRSGYCDAMDGDPPRESGQLACVPGETWMAIRKAPAVSRRGATPDLNVRHASAIPVLSYSSQKRVRMHDRYQLMDRPSEPGARDQKQQIRVDVPHGRCRRKMLCRMGKALFLHTASPVASRPRRHPGYFVCAPATGTRTRSLRIQVRHERRKCAAVARLRKGGVPCLRRHKASGRAVTLSGQDFYRGTWGSKSTVSKSALAEYDRQVTACAASRSGPRFELSGGAPSRPGRSRFSVRRA